MPMTTPFMCPNCGNDQTNTDGSCSRCGYGTFPNGYADPQKADPTPVYAISVDFTSCDHYAKCDGHEADMWHDIAMTLAGELVALNTPVKDALPPDKLNKAINDILGREMIDWCNRKRKAERS